MFIKTLLLASHAKANLGNELQKFVNLKNNSQFRIFLFGLLFHDPNNPIIKKIRVILPVFYNLSFRNKRK